MTTQRQHAPIELHLLLCKALRSGEMTLELVWRASEFFNYLYARHKPRDGFQQTAVISGGGGEAAAVRVWLHQQQAQYFRPPFTLIGLDGTEEEGPTFLETKSPNSRLNIAMTLDTLRKKNLLGRVCLYLNSSDYHCTGLTELRYLLPHVSPFSLVKEHDAILDVVKIGAPYRYLGCRIQELDWLSRAYLTRQRLRLTWENLRGITGMPGKEELRIDEVERTRLGLTIPALTVNFFLEESVKRLHDAIVCFQLLKSKNFTPVDKLGDRVERARRNIDGFLQEVQPHMQWLTEHVGPVTGDALDEWIARAKALEPFVNPSHIDDVDPDTEAYRWESLCTQR